jgi:AP endonuclease-2
MNLQMFLANVSCTTNIHPLLPDSVVTDEAKIRKTQTRNADSSIETMVTVECDYMENTTTHNSVDEACENCADEGDVGSEREIRKVWCTDGIHHNKSSHMKSLDESQETKSVDAKRESVQSEWKRIQATMARRIPVCEGHGEPCVFRAVIKKGPNLGRGFYVCARAQASLFHLTLDYICLLM